MARIFISYSRADKQFIEQFIPLIRKVYGQDSLWYDDEIHGGTDWWHLILRQVADCELFIYLISNESLESPYCQAEFREAIRLGKQILPVTVRRLKPAYPQGADEDLQAILVKTQYVDMVQGFKDARAQANLYGSINRLLESEQVEQVPNSEPIPEPPVPDKPQEDSKVRPAYIGGILLIVILIIASILWQSIFANGDDTVGSSTVATLPPVDASLTAISAKATATGRVTQEYVEATQTQTAEFANMTASAETAIAIETEVAIRLVLARAENFTGTQNKDWQSITSEFDGVEMVLVPVGCFMMGSEDGDSNERPVEEQCIDEPFWIDKTEVTQDDFIRLGGEQANSLYSINNGFPIEQITWFEAEAFCKEIRGGSLPTELQWEYAARGVESWAYPWGDYFEGENVVWGENSVGEAASVGSRPNGASWVGAMDMSGNMWEWTSTIYEKYPYNPKDGREDNTQEGLDIIRVLRGGSWNEINALYTFSRYGGAAIERNSVRGFRCVRPVD